MGQSDWTVIAGAAATTSINNGVTAGTIKPTGSGLHTYGFNSLDATDGVSAQWAAQTDFNPIATRGASVRGAIRRGPSTVSTGSAPFFFTSLQTDSISDEAYILGLSDGDPYSIVLRKGTLATGVVDGAVAPTTAPDHILMKSAQTYTGNDWLHLRMDVLDQSGDIVIHVFENDLEVQGVDVPVWTVVPGMEGPGAPAVAGFVDDGVAATGTAVLQGGYLGYGIRSQAAGARAYFDYISCSRQL